MNPDPTSLDRLHDVLSPPPAQWWPPAPGWHWLLSGLAILGCVFAIRAFLHWQRNRYRREALAEWRRQAPLLSDPAQRATALAGMAELLKRTALSALPRDQVASLTGSAWLTFLDRTGATNQFTTGSGALLERSAYDPRAAAALDDAGAAEVAELVRRWLQNHRLESGAKY